MIKMVVSRHTVKAQISLLLRSSLIRVYIVVILLSHLGIAEVRYMFHFTGVFVGLDGINFLNP